MGPPCSTWPWWPNSTDATSVRCRSSRPRWPPACSSGWPPSQPQLLGEALAGRQLVTLALHPLGGGSLRMVPAGAVADQVLLLDGDRLLVAKARPSATGVANLGSLPVADVTVSESTVLGSGPAAVRAFQSAIDEWLVLMASALAGLAARALEIGVDYVKDRHAFGVPIGSFQAVAHGLADAATAVDGSRLFSREAAWAAAGGAGTDPRVGCLGLAFNAEAARQASYRSLHYHGGTAS